MRIRRCYTQQPLTAGALIDLDNASQHHLVKVLRARAGDPLILFNGDGFDYQGVLSKVSKRDAQVHIDQQVKVDTEPTRKIILVQAIAKGERMDWIMQKASELGVHSIQPVYTERSMVKHQEGRLPKKLTHWRSIIISACEQCGRAFIPTIEPPIKLFDLQLPEQYTRIVLHPPPLGVSQNLLNVAGEQTEIALTIGPEGGFSDTEIEYLLAQQYMAVQLGTRILRTETAGMAALSLLNLT